MPNPQYRLEKKFILDNIPNLTIHEKTTGPYTIRIVCAPQKGLFYIQATTHTTTYLMDDLESLIPKEPYENLIVTLIQEKKLELAQLHDSSTQDAHPVKRKASQEDIENAMQQEKRLKKSEDEDHKLAGTYRITPKKYMIDPLTYEMHDEYGNKLEIIIDSNQYFICYHTHTIYGDYEQFDDPNNICLIETVAWKAINFGKLHGIKLEELNTPAAEPAPQNDLQENASQESVADIFAYQEKKPDANQIKQGLDSQESIQDFAPTFKLQTPKQAATGANKTPATNQELVKLHDYLAALVRGPKITDDISSSENSTDNEACQFLGNHTQEGCE